MEIEEPAPKYYPKMSPSEFLIWERQQDLKHEYVNGKVLAMSGASYNQNKISSNIQGRIWSFLQDKSCDVWEAIYASPLNGIILTSILMLLLFVMNLNLMMKK